MNFFSSKRKDSDSAKDVTAIKEAEIAKMSVEERAHLDKMMNDPTTKGEMDKKLGMLDEAVNDEGGNHVTHESLEDAERVLEAVMAEEAELFSGAAVWVLGALGKTRRELAAAFCHHAEVRDKDGVVLGFDTDKATKRLRKYAHAMHKNAFVLESMTLERIEWMHESIRSKGWFRYLDQTDKEGRAILMMSFNDAPFDSIDREFYTRMSAYFFLLFHGLMFEPVCNEKGLVYVNDYTGLDISIMFKVREFIDPKTKDAMQELMIGTMPIKTKAMYLCNLPWWMQIPFRFAMLFLGAKLRSRIRLTSERKRKVYREVAEQGFWPSNVGGGGPPIHEWPMARMDSFVAQFRKNMADKKSDAQP